MEPLIKPHAVAPAALRVADKARVLHMSDKQRRSGARKARPKGLAPKTRLLRCPTWP